MGEIIFVRHGQSQANADLVLATPDSPLTELGRSQAQQTARKLKDMGIKHIVSSPFVRTRQTAEIIADELGIPRDQITTMDELKEKYIGELVGKPKTHDSTWYYQAEGELGIESRADLIQRMSLALDKLSDLAKQHGTVLAVGHSASGSYLLEVSKGRKHFDEFEPYQEIMNADIVKIASR